MAKSAFEYVKQFEANDQILLNTWIVVRIDGKNFRKFADSHDFLKPNDKRSLNLMNKSAVSVMNEMHDIILAYGQSDEYSFIFDRRTTLYKRRLSKILTNVCSLFTSSFVFYWTDFFPKDKMIYPPSFDGRIIVYPTNKNLRDYLSWRQTDCHINNLYNTTFWALVLEGGLTRQEAEEKLRFTVSAEKNEILFTDYGINYNNEESFFKKGTFIIREKLHKKPVVLENPSPVTDSGIYVSHIDIIGNKFWNDNPHILGQE